MKKVLSLVLALVMVLGSFSFVAAADFSDVNGTNNGEAITRLSELNLLKGYPDGTFKPENQITRAEFAAVMVRAKGLEAVAETTKGLPTGFNDVAGFHWASGYVGTASKAGIVNGIGNGLFAPEAPVKYEDAITMVVRALGYEASAQTKGGYPYGYLIVASELDLLEDARGTQGLPATRAFVAQITDNALEVPMMVQVGFGSDAKWVVSGSKEHGDDAQERYLLDEMGFDSIEGRVTSYNDSRNTITLDGDDKGTYDVVDGFDFYEVEGVLIKAWIDGDEVIVHKLEEEVLFDAVKYVSKDKEIELITADESYEVANKATFTIDGNKKDADEFTVNYAKIVLNDDNEIVWAEGYTLNNVIVVEDVEDEVIVDLDDSDLDVEDFLLVKEGKTIAAADLETGDVVFYNDGEEFAVVYNNSIEGTIDRAYTDSFRLDGKTYDLSEIAAIYIDGDDLDGIGTDGKVLADFEDEGEEVEIFFDFKGDVVLVVGPRGNAKTTTIGAILTENAKVYSNRNKLNLPLDMVNKNDEKVSFDADKDVDIYKIGSPTKYDPLVDGDTVFSQFNVVEYKVDEDGDLTEVKGLTAETPVVGGEVKVDARYASGMRLQSSTVVFLLDGSKVDEVFTWADADDYFGKMTDFVVYGNDKQDAKYIVVSGSDAGKYDEEFGVITKTKELSSGDYDVTINIDGKAYTIEVASDDVYELEGKIVKFEISEDMDVIKDDAITEKTDDSGEFKIVSSRDKTFKVDNGTTYQLVSDAVVFDATGSSVKVININDIEDGDTVEVMMDGNSSRYVKYLVVTDEVVETPGSGQTAELEDAFVARGNTWVTIDGVDYIYGGPDNLSTLLGKVGEVTYTTRTVEGDVVVTAIAVVPAP